MADKEKQLTLTITTRHQAAVRGMVAVGGSLQQLSQKAIKAQSSLKSINAFATLKNQTVAAEKAWKSATGEVASLARELKRTEKPTQAQTREFTKAKKAAAQLKNEYKKNSLKLNDMRRSMKLAGVSTASLSIEQQKLKSSFQQLRGEAVQISKLNTARGLLDVRPHREVNREIKKLNAAYARLKVAHGKGTISSRELYNAQLQLQRKTSELKTSTNGWTESIIKARGGLMALAGVGYTVMKSVQGYASFEQRMAEVGTLTEASAERLSKLSDEISKMSMEIPQTANSLAAAEYDILSAGVALEKSAGVLELSAKAAVAGVTDTKTAVNAGLGVVNAYGLQIDQLESVYDVLFQTVKRGVTTFPELSQSLGETLPTAKAAGVDYRDVGAAIAALTQAGIKTPKAATALKGAINAMAAPAPEAKKKFDALGITWQGLIPTLEQIAKKNLSLDQMRLLIPDTEARTGVLALTQNIDKLKGSADAMVNSAGSMNAALDKMKDTPENQLIKLQNSLSQLGRETGAFVSVFLLPAAETLRELLVGLNEMPKPVKAFVLALAAGGTAIGVWKLGLRDIAIGLRGMKVHMLETAAASNSMGNKVVSSSGRIDAALMKNMGTIALIGTSVALVSGAVVAYQRMRRAQDEAAAAAERLAMSEARNQGIVAFANETTGLQIKNIRELNQLLRDGKIVVDELTGEFLTLTQAQERQADQTERQVELDQQRQESMQRIIDYNKEMEEQYGEFDIAAINAKYAQDLLNEAVAAAESPLEELKRNVQKAAEAYADAKDELRKLTEGTEEYAKQLEKVNKLKKAGIDKDKQYKQALFRAEEKRLKQEDQALKNSLERRKLQLDKQLQDDLISRDEYAYEVIRAEEDMQEKILLLKQQGMDGAKKYLGEESDEYKRKTQEKIDAELDLQRVKLEGQETQENLGTSSSGRGGSGGSRGSGGSSSRTGSSGGKIPQGERDYLEGKYTKPTRLGNETQRQANDRYKSERAAAAQNQDDQAAALDKKEKAGKSAFAGGFYANWDSITNGLNNISSIGKLKEWYQQNKQYMGAQGQLTSSPFSRILNQHATDLYRQRMSELATANVSKNRVDNSALQKRNVEQRQITLRFLGQEGKSVSGSFGENDAGKLMEILKQSGMVTA